jgi:hypothetical protein
VDRFERSPDSIVGNMIQQTNVEGYLFKNQACLSPRKMNRRGTGNFGNNIKTPVSGKSAFSKSSEISDLSI